MSIIQLRGTELYQWDSDRQIEVHPWQNYTVDEIHFLNPNSDSILEVELTVEGESVIANIPNMLLQTTVNIRVFAVMHTDNGERTISECTFGINPRPKPSDYVYTETEIKNYSDLEKRISALENGTGGYDENLLKRQHINGFREFFISNIVRGEELSISYDEPLTVTFPEDMYDSIIADIENFEQEHSTMTLDEVLDNLYGLHTLVGLYISTAIINTLGQRIVQLDKEIKSLKEDTVINYNEINAILQAVVGEVA